MKKKIMFKCFLVTLVSVIIVFASGIGIMYASGRKVIKERLVSETSLAASLLNYSGDIKGLDNFEGKDDLRITVISEAGEVLFESDTADEMENHLNREEVRGALSGNPVTVERYSSTFGCKMTYYALKTGLADGTSVIVRLAVRSNRISSYILTSLPFLVLTLAAALAVAALFADRISKNIADKITEVNSSLKSLNDGEYKPLKANMNEPEFYALFDEINELNEKTEKHIKQVENEHIKLNAVLENVMQGILALNASGEIVFVNGAAQRMFGGGADLEGRKLIYLIDDKKLTDKIEEAAHSCGGNFEYTAADGIYSVSVKILSDEESTGEIREVVIFTDVTNEKLIARQKSEFFANASHELKTPLTAMQGLSELLLEKDNIDSGSKKQIERIHKESVRLNSLILDMLRLSNLERMESEDDKIQPVRLEETAAEVAAELSHELSAKNIELKVLGSGTVYADPKKIYELVNNIVGNAVNYNKENGTVNISIEDNRSGVVFRVADSGIGIAEEHIPRLCERFYRVDKSRSKKTGGTGLGLAIVKHICAVYGAELKIESELGKGTEVTVKFGKPEV